MTRTADCPLYAALSGPRVNDIAPAKEMPIGQRIGRRGQAQVGGELFAQGLERLFGLVAAHVGLGQLFAGSGGGGEASAARRVIGGREAPLFVGPVAILRELFD